MKVKKLFLPLILAFLLVPSTMFFAGCVQEQITDVRVSGVKQTFELNEEFSFGENVKVEKQINGKTWEEVASDAYSFNSQKSTFNSAVAGEYVIYVSIKNTNKEVSYTVEVLKGNTSFVSIQPINATYGQRLSNLTLPQGYVWVNPNAEVGVVTDQNGREFDVTYTKNSNYNPVNGKVKVIVGKANTDFVAIGPLNAVYGQTLNDIDLPMGYYWNQSSQSVGDATGSEGREFDIRYLKNMNYNPVSGKVKVIVAKADLTFVAINPLNAIYGQTLADISLPQGYAWVNPNESVGNVTDQNGREFDVEYFVDNNHKTAQGKVKVIVAKANSTFVAINPLNAFVGQTLSEIALPQGYAWVNASLSVGSETDANGREFEATYCPNANNYNASQGTIKLIVSKQLSTWVPLAPVNATYGQKLNEIALPQGYAWVNPDEFVGNATDANGREFDATFIEDENHSAVNGKIVVVVAKANATFEMISPVNATYGQVLSEIALPQGYSWVNSNQSVGDVTDQNGREFDVTFVKSANHNSINGKVVVIVAKADITLLTKPTASSAVVYFPLSSSILTGGEVEQDVEGTFVWENSEEIILVTGSRTFEAKFVPVSSNYNVLENIQIEIRIDKYNLSNAVVELNEEVFYYNNGADIEPTIKSIKDLSNPNVVIPVKNSSNEDNYRVVFGSNSEVGTAIMQIQGLGNCEGNLISNFQISKKLIGSKLEYNGTHYYFYADEEIDFADQVKVYKKYEYFEWEFIDEDILDNSEYTFATENQESFNPNLYDESQTLYVWYNGQRSNENILITIQSLKVVEFNVEHSAFKKTYELNEDIILDGADLVVTEKYNSGKSATLTYSATEKAGSYTITSDYDKSQTGEYTITIKSFYKNEYGYDVTYSFVVNVQETMTITGIERIELANKCYVGASLDDLVFNIFVYYNGNSQLTNFYGQVKGNEVEFVAGVLDDTVVDYDSTSSNLQYVKVYIENNTISEIGIFALSIDQVVSGYIEYKGTKYGPSTTILIPYNDSTYSQDLKAYYEFESGAVEQCSTIDGLNNVDTTQANSEIYISFQKNGYNYYSFTLKVGEAPKSTNLSISYKLNQEDDYTLITGEGDDFTISDEFGKHMMYFSFEFESQTAFIDGYYYFGSNIVDASKFSVMAGYPTFELSGLTNRLGNITICLNVKDGSLSREIKIIVQRQSPFSSILFNGTSVSYADFIQMDYVEFGTNIEFVLANANDYRMVISYQDRTSIQMINPYADFQIFDAMSNQVFTKTLNTYVLNSLEIGKVNNFKQYNKLRYGESVTYELDANQDTLIIKLGTISTLSELYLSIDEDFNRTQISGDIIINNPSEVSNIAIMIPQEYGGYSSIITIKVNNFSYLSEVAVNTMSIYGGENNNILVSEKQQSSINGSIVNYSISISSDQVFSGLDFTFKPGFENFTAKLYADNGQEFDFTNYKQCQVLAIKVFDANDDLVETLYADFTQSLMIKLNNQMLYDAMNSPLNVYVLTTEADNVLSTEWEYVAISSATSNINYAEYGIYEHNYVYEFTLDGNAKVNVNANLIINYSQNALEEEFNFIQFEIHSLDDYNTFYYQVNLADNKLNNSISIADDLDEIIQSLNANEYQSRYSLVNPGSTCVFSREGKNIKVVVTDEMQNSKTMFIQMQYRGFVDNNTNIKSISLRGMTGGTIQTFDANANSINLTDMNKTKTLEVVTANEYAKVELFKANELSNPIQCGFGQVYLTFSEAGNYVVKITATNGEATKSISVSASGDFPPLIEVTFGEDTYYFDMDIESGTTMSGDFSPIIGEYGIEGLYVYVGEQTINENKVSLSARTCFADVVYDINGNQITDLDNIQLDVIEYNGLDCAMVLIKIEEEMTIPVYFYLCDKIVPVTITIGTKSFIIEYDMAQIMQGKLGDFTASSMMELDFKATATMEELGLTEIPATINGTINFGQVYQDGRYAIATDLSYSGAPGQEDMLLTPSVGNLTLNDIVFTIYQPSPESNASVVFIVNLVENGESIPLPLMIEILGSANVL